jgi:membrane protein YqaA with SNARE-associated domain
VDRRLVLLLVLAFVWGLSEATIFFIVPDVIISAIALEYGFRKGLVAAGISVLGAVLGGALIYAWGKIDIVGARAVFELLPAIAPSTIARATTEMSEPLIGTSMLKGSMTGVPFKLYASEAGAIGISLWTFIALTPLVRLPRFLIAATGAALARRFAPGFFQSPRLKLLGLFWVVFYAIYWMSAPW